MKTELKEIELSVCEDCYFKFHYSDYLTNDFYNTEHLTKEDKQNIEDSFNKISQEFELEEDYIYSDRLQSDGYFSHYSCDMCNSNLSGNRFDLTGIEHNPGKTS